MHHKNIRKIWIGMILFFAIGMIAPFTSHAERITNFSSEIIVQNNADVLVTETITYDFEGASRHGIFRDIPRNTSDGASLKINSIATVDEKGVPYMKSATSDSAAVHIKIGDPDTFVTGVKTYRLSYRVENALVSFDTYDELYWNVTGNGWGVPIDRASAKVIFADKSIEMLQFSCYQGEVGSTEECSVDSKGTEFIAGPLPSGDGLTVAIGFSPDIVQGIDRVGGQINTSPATDLATPENVMVKIIVGTFSFIALFGTFLYWKKMRDPKSKNPIIAWYQPPADFSPILLGTLIDKETDMRDISGQILHLAARGYISIMRIEEKQLMVFNNSDYIFTIMKDPAGLTFEGDKKVIELLFSRQIVPVGTQIAVSDLEKNSKLGVQKILKETQDAAKSFLTEGGYYEAEKNKVIPKIVAMFFFLVPLAVFFFGLQELDNFFVGTVVIGIICGSILVGIKQKYTELGVETRQKILGFKNFLSVTDKERFDFHNAPEKNPGQFMEYLPHAVALGIEKKWAEQFSGMMIPQPIWYRGGAAHAFVATDFVTQMGAMSKALASAATPASSGSGGGGSSGGGGGGGGGGSW